MAESAETRHGATRPIPVVTRAPAGPVTERYTERRVPAFVRWALSVLSFLGLPTAGLLRRLRRARYSGPPPVCRTEGPDVVISGTVFPKDSKTYLILPFEVGPGASRLEVEYEFEALGPALPKNLVTQTILDLGLWDRRGYRSAEGFRGWSGSRQRRVFLEACRATRCYRPGAIEPGTWYAELGLAAIGPTGATWTVRARARSGAQGPDRAPRPVDRDHVANPEPGWYHGDFHMHSWHSNPKGPSRRRFLEYARRAGLDFTPVTEYVVGQHWDEYGPVQDRNPDVLIWPGREIITYFGHMQCIGETPGFIEYRHGFEDVSVREIQRAVRDAGALFQVNHPTTFKGRLFQNLCRGCAFELGDEIDWDGVDTVEVLTGEAVVRRKLFMRKIHAEIENPFMGSAIEFWEQLLNRGHRVTAVCGSDVKKGKGLGSCATAVFARELSRAGLTEAIRDGRAYVRTRGVADSPELELTARTADGRTGTFGACLEVAADETVEVRVSVRAGGGQSLRVVRNGDEVDVVRVRGEHFVHEIAATRAPADEGPLGTWWRVETFDDRSRTTIGNPVFLVDPVRRGPAVPAPPPRINRRLRRNIAAARSFASLPHGG
jgi:hypothetical protein